MGMDTDMVRWSNMADKHFDEVAVNETTPQGTQENGVAKGHDERDINLRAILAWFAGLAVMTILTFAAMYGMFRLLANREEVKDILPSPLFARQQQKRPPAPRLLPTPWEAHAKEKQNENERLERIGLLDPKTGLPKIPANATNAVNQPGGGAGQGATGVSGAGTGGVTTNPGAGSNPAEGVSGQVPRPVLPHDSSGGRSLELNQE
jgi:hypothetical protein